MKGWNEHRKDSIVHSLIIRFTRHLIIETVLMKQIVTVEFAFKYNSQKFGFFMDYSGRDKKRSQK